jgi:ornithine carbamoyltransferase
MEQLGGRAFYFSAQDLQLSRGESLPDTARIFSRYVDGIVARVFDHSDLEVLARYASIPVINGLSDQFHPCQALSDLYTIWEKRGDLKDLTIAFLGDGNNNVTNSLLLLCAKLGVNFKVACPEKYSPRPEILALAQADLEKSGAKINILHHPEAAVKEAEVIYTDVWVSMGRINEKERIKAMKPFQVNSELVKLAKKEVWVMHCLPAHRGQEITDEVLDGPHSIVFDQAENRLHLQKALLLKLLK